MLSNVPKRLFVAPALLIVAGAAYAQSGSTSAGTQGGSTQYVISIGEGSATLEPQNPLTGSVPEGKATPGVLPLSLNDALERGLKQNLGLLLSGETILAARGQRWKDLSELLPNVTTATSFNESQVALKAQNGFRFNLPGVSTPAVIGPFGYFDARARLNQSIFNWQFIEQVRSAGWQVRAAEGSFRDARELVVFVVASAYLQTIADSARVETAVAQRDTAQALSKQAADQLEAGTTAAIDALRAKVELQAREQQLISARNDFAKQKLALARVIGLPPGQEFTLTDKPGYQPVAQMGIDEALRRAYASRPDYQSALAQVSAAELARKAAVAEYFPFLAAHVDYGDVGITPASSQGTVNASATLNFPIFQGGKVHGDVLEAEAALRQTRQRLENLRGQIDQDVRNADLDLQSAADRVEVARSSVDLADQTLRQARDRFAAGVADNIEVIQAQESLAGANESFISSLYSYNVAKIELARAIGYAEAGVQEYLKGK